MPDTRPSVKQPVVDRKVLDSTSRRIEEKQAAKMSRKLRELESLTGFIQSAETQHRTTYASFESAAKQLSPELATNLEVKARQLYQVYRDDLATEKAAWEAYLTSDREAHAALQNAPDKERREILDQLKGIINVLRSPHHRIHLAQAGLLDAERQIAGRLGFIRDQAPDLVSAQAGLIDAWIRTSELGGAYGATADSLYQLYDAAESRARRMLGPAREVDRARVTLEKLTTRLADREVTLKEIRETRAALEATLESTVDPTQKKRGDDTKRKISDLQKRLERIERDQKKDQADMVRQEASLKSRIDALDKAAADLAQKLSEINDARRAVHDARAPYMDSMQRSLALQESIHAKLSETLERLGADPTPVAKETTP